MPSLVVNNAALLRLIWTLNGNPYAVNVFGAVNSGGSAATQAACNALGTAIKNALTSTAHVGNLSSTVALQRVMLRNISIPNQIEYQDAASPVVGTSSAVLLPPQTSLCVTLRTALAGRSYRGRTYLPGFHEDSNSAGGTIGSASADAAVAFVTAIITAMAAQSLPMAIVSRPQYNEAGTLTRAGFATPVTVAVNRDLVWDTQRRRAVPGI